MNNISFFQSQDQSCAFSMTELPKKRSAFIAKDQDPTSHRIIEKRRRDRMNNCLADLSRLIPTDFLKKGRGRIEKTEIIEMATRYIKYLQDHRKIEQQANEPTEHFRLGFEECMSEVMRYLVDKQGHYSSDNLCIQIINHLQHHSGKFAKGAMINQHSNPDNSSSGSSNEYVSHNPKITVRDLQHMKERDRDNNNTDSHFKHSNIYAAHTNDKSYNFLVDVGHSQMVTDQMNESPENTIYDHQGVFPLQNGIKVSDNNLEKYNARGNFMKNMSFMDKEEYRSLQDTNVNNVYAPIAPYHTQHQINSDNSLRRIRKTDSSQPSDSGLSVNGNADIDNIHSYKFKNTIKQRFSQSQSTDYSSSSPSDGVTNGRTITTNEFSPLRREQLHGNGKFIHKRRKLNDHNIRHINNNCDQSSSSGTNYSEAMISKIPNSSYMCNTIQDSKDSLIDSSIKTAKITIEKINVENIDAPEKFKERFSSRLSGPVGVPIFALHAKGSFYIPMNVDYDSLIPFLGQYDLLDTTALQPNIALHPVTISVNFQPMLINK